MDDCIDITLRYNQISANDEKEFAVATNLVVRNIEPEVVQALKEVAAANGRSAEAEHREILRSVLSRPGRRTFKEILAEMPDVGIDADFDFRRG